MQDTNPEKTDFNHASVVAAANRALIAADPLYFTWPPEQQELFRTSMKFDAYRRAMRELLRSLVDIKCSLDQVDDVWDEAAPNQLKLLHRAKLYVTGIGEDSFVLNEFMADGVTLLNFETLYDYDYDDHLFQEESRRQDSPNYQGADYYAWRFPPWAELLIDGDYFHATLLSVATYIINEIESAGNNLIIQLIPHEYVDGPDFGKPERSGFHFDRKLAAGGQEKQLEELEARWSRYQNTRWLELSKKFSQSPPAVYTIDHSLKNDPFRFFIFTNAELLKKIRWRHFLSDCGPFVTDFAILQKQVSQETERATAWITENHRDIINNFDPNVVKLQKKTKVVLTASALEGLNKFLYGDEPDE